MNTAAVPDGQPQHATVGNSLRSLLAALGGPRRAPIALVTTAGKKKGCGLKTRQRSRFSQTVFQ